MSIIDDLEKATRTVSKDWKKAKQEADKNDNVSSRRLYRMRYVAPARTSVREVAFRVMESAYNKASANGKYYANARQIMYAARPQILAEADADELSDVYFTQTLLKDYLEQYRPAWKVVWDARGNLIEPHTRTRVALGGIDVTKYSDKWRTADTYGIPAIAHEIDTSGPANRYANALFIEKEGFTEILSAARIPEQYDMALMSTKGIPNGAACELIASMRKQGVRVFVLHDFDLAGFKIVRTLRRGTRLQTGSEVVQLGFRLADVEGLEAEPVSYKQDRNPQHYLRECGATPEERDFLVSSGGYGRWQGERVELNAMTSEQLITWLTAKLAEHGVEKVVPDTETIDAAYRSARRLVLLEQRIEELVDDEIEDGDVPKGLREQIIAKMQNGSGSMSWDKILWNLAEDADEEEDSSSQPTEPSQPTDEPQPDVEAALRSRFECWQDGDLEAYSRAAFEQWRKLGWLTDEEIAFHDEQVRLNDEHE